MESNPSFLSYCSHTPQQSVRYIFSSSLSLFLFSRFPSPTRKISQNTAFTLIPHTTSRQISIIRKVNLTSPP